MSSQVTLILLS